MLFIRLAFRRNTLVFFFGRVRFQREGLVGGLTTSLPVRAACLAIMPLVLLTQVAKGLAYPVNGVIMGKAMRPPAAASPLPRWRP
jgi:hypothetical protein